MEERHTKKERESGTGIKSSTTNGSNVLTEFVFAFIQTHNSEFCRLKGVFFCVFFKKVEFCTTRSVYNSCICGERSHEKPFVVSNGAAQYLKLPQEMSLESTRRRI